MSEKSKTIRLTDIPGVTPSIAEKLEASGFSTPWAIVVARIDELAEKTGLPQTTAERIIENARRLLGITFKTAKEIKAERMSVKKLTSGSKNLDDLLGGGIETRTITEFFGEYGSGKCVSKDTPLVFINPRSIDVASIEDLYERYRKIYGETPFEEGFIVRAPGLKVFAYSGREVRVVEAPYIYRERVGKILAIRTEMGNVVKITGKHPLLVLNEHGMGWRRAFEIRVGDWIASPARIDTESNDAQLVSDDDAYFMGVFVAKGSLNPPSIIGIPDRVAAWVKNYINEKLGHSPLIEKTMDEKLVVVLKGVLDRLLGVATNDGKERILRTLLNAPLSAVRSFLAGYIDAGGGFVNNDTVELIAEKEEIAVVLSYLLRRLGVASSLKSESEEGIRYRIVISGRDRLALQSLPFRHVKIDRPESQGVEENVPGVLMKIIQRAYLSVEDFSAGSMVCRMDDNLHHLYVARSEVERCMSVLKELRKRLIDEEQEIQCELKDNGVSGDECWEILRGLKRRVELIDETLAVVEKALALRWERVERVDELEYNDYVYDVVVPGYENFVGGFMPLILHNTQICHQLAVNVQLPPEKGGLSGKAVYVDTEGTFRWERIEAMARGVGIAVDEAMENIFYQRAYNSDHQISIVDELFRFVPENNVKLVIVDSVTSHFRAEYPGREHLALRQQRLNAHLHQLVKLAEIYNIAVVVTNQVMARPDVFYGDPTQPIGGHVLAHTPGVRVQLRKARGNKRIARVVDAPHLPEGEAVFAIVEEGIRDPEE